MKNSLSTFLVTGAALFAAMQSVSAADEHGSEAEAEDMVKRAVSVIQREGSAKAYKAFNEPEGKSFKDKDLFVFVYDFQGNVLASSGIAKVIGKNLIDMKDADGQPIVRGVLDMVKKNKKGWYGPYRFSNPRTQEYERKKSYCEQAANDVLVCVGAYLGR
ncbi:MAG TPA: cache domain-containing protein [Noviherbaspirillum sp.]